MPRHDDLLLTEGGLGRRPESLRRAKLGPSSHEFWPVVVRRKIWACPFLTIRVDTRSSEIAVLRVFENGDPRRRFWMLEPLKIIVSVPCFDWVLRCGD